MTVDSNTINGLAIDLAKVQTTVTESARRLENIERSMSGLNDLSLLIMNTKNLAEGNERRISIVEIRAETIDKNVEALATVGIRLSTLETDIIKNGELRISTLEKGKTAVIAMLGTISLAAVAWFLLTYVVPVIVAHHS